CQRLHEELGRQLWASRAEDASRAEHVSRPQAQGVGVHEEVSSLLRNSSDTAMPPRIAAMAMASRTLGSFRPRSMLTIVWRLTPALRASSSWDRPARSRCSFTLESNGDMPIIMISRPAGVKNTLQRILYGGVCDRSVRPDWPPQTSRRPRDP